MVEMARLPAEHAGLLLRWGMRLYGEGRPVPLAEARADAAMDDRAWHILLQSINHLIDRERFAAGELVVTAFAEAATRRDAVSAARVRAPRREPAELPVAIGDLTSKRETRPEHPNARPTSAPSSRPTKVSLENEAAVRSLVVAGVTETEARACVARWIARYGLRAVEDAVALLGGRSIARPAPYVERVLENEASQRLRDMPREIRMAAGPALPRPIKRRLHVGAQASWTFEGWTARGHRRGGATVQERKAVWRTDAGTLNYRDPAPGEYVPDYDEDPGVYEQD